MKKMLRPIVILALPIFSIVAATLYYRYHIKDRNLDEYSSVNNVRTLEIRIPNESISTIIGRGGENIQSIQSKTNTKINFRTPEGDVNYRFCRIRGNKEDIQLAEMMIFEMVNSQINKVTREIKVPQKSCGRIIGRCGDNIRSISRASNCAITVDRLGAAEDSYRTVTMRGTDAQIALAQQLIEEKIAEDEEARSRMQQTLSTRSPRMRNNFRKRQETDNSTPKFERLITSTNESMLQVYVSAVANPTHFWVQLISPRAVELDHLVENMTDYYQQEESRNLHKFKEVTPGQIVACRVAEDNKWYRVEVCSVEPYRDDRDETQVDVFYVDYGDSAYQKLGDLFDLRTDFLSLRFQAIECAMDGIMPKSGSTNDSWDEDTISLFEDMVYVGQWKAFSAQVVRYKPRRNSNRRDGSPVPCIKLYDPDGPPGVDVGKQLIDKGVALPFDIEAEAEKEKEDDADDVDIKESQSVENGTSC